MQELIGKKVEVKTVETVYAGILVEISETDVNLQAETGWIVIPLDRVLDISSVS